MPYNKLAIATSEQRPFHGIASDTVEGGSISLPCRPDALESRMPAQLGSVFLPALPASKNFRFETNSTALLKNEISPLFSGEIKQTLMATTQSILKRAFSHSARVLQQQEHIIRPPVQVSGVEGKYASALYSSGVKEKNLDKLEKEMNQVKSIYDTNQDFKVEFICRN